MLQGAVPERTAPAGDTCRAVVDAAFADDCEDPRSAEAEEERNNNERIRAERSVRERVDRLASLIWPTVALSAMCVIINRVFDIPTSGAAPWVSLLPFENQSGEDNVGLAILQANANAMSIVAVVVVLTYLFVGAFAWKLQTTLDFLVQAAFVFCWGAFTFWFLREAFPLLDLISCSIMSLNSAVGGLWSVFYAYEEDWSVSHCYRIYIGAIIAYPFMCLPELTILFTLIWMIIWDIVAVLTPCGPLRYALSIQQQRQWMAQDDFLLPRGMVIRAGLYELGLGDLVFFGVIVGRAASVNYVTLVACIVAMLASVVFTVAATVAIGRTIPALPIALAIGLAVYLMARFTADAYLDALVYY